VSLGHLDAFLGRSAGALCRSPIFIIGCPRSGTTALARALGQHSQLWTSHESYFLNSLYGGGRAEDAWRRDAEREKAPSWLKTEEVSRQEFLGWLGAGVNALYTSRSGGRRWIDQTPLNTLMVDDLADMFSGAVFVHIVRDGRHVVHSMENFLRKFEEREGAKRYVPAWATDFGEACRTWRTWVETATAFCQRNPERATTVVNERLSADPETGFADLYRFLGLGPEQGPITSFGAERVNSSFGESGRSPSSAADCLPRWDDDRRTTFAEEAGDLLVASGLASPDELQDWVAGALHVRSTTACGDG
jgi:hypothetical protein